MQFLAAEPTEFEIDHETRLTAAIAAETGSYGPELEIDPTVSGDGKRVSLNFVISHGAGEPVEIPARVGVLKKRGGTAPTMVSRAMPRDRCSTGSYVASGERVLVSAMRRAPLITDGGGGDETELLLTFLRATVADPEVPNEPSVALNDTARIGVEVAVFEVDPAEAVALTWRRGGGGSDEAIYGDLMVRAAEGKAKLVALNYVSSRFGNRAKVGRASQFVYPTEYELPLMAPTARETRDVGQRLEVDPVLSVIWGSGQGRGRRSLRWRAEVRGGRARGLGEFRLGRCRVGEL